MQQLLFLFLFLAMSITSGAQVYTFLTYNIRYDNPGDGEDAWPVRREFLSGQIRFHAPDVFGIQEAQKHQLDYLLEVLPDYTYVGVGREDGREGGEYSALLYRADRFRAVQSGTFWLSGTPDSVSKDWDAAYPRICTWALLQDTAAGSRFWVFNTHFDHVGKTARQESATLILKQIGALNTTGDPVVLMGDFNCEPDDAPRQVLTEALLDTHDHTIQPPFGPEGTFNGFNFHDPVTRRIDYIFVSGDWRIEQYAVLSDSRNCHYPSDHLPVFVRLHLP